MGKMILSGLCLPCHHMRFVGLQVNLRLNPGFGALYCNRLYSTILKTSAEDMTLLFLDELLKCNYYSRNLISTTQN